jgi:hypothetical protein
VTGVQTCALPICVNDPLPLVRRLSTIIQEMHRDGKLKDLSQKYYRGDFTTRAAQFDFQALGQTP